MILKNKLGKVHIGQSVKAIGFVFIAVGEFFW